MGATTAIEWTDATWNPWMGCFKVSPGCKACYMYRDMERYGRDPKAVTRTSPATFNAPLKWKEPKLVFTCSWSDWFIEEADEWRNDAWDVVRKTPHLTYQILTKRPERILDHLPYYWHELKNVWLGISAENQKYLEERLPDLLRFNVPSGIRFISYEPALGPLTLSLAFIRQGCLTNRLEDGTKAISWLIAGGESGAKDKIRIANPAMFVDIRDQCQIHDINFFFKQYGGSSRIEGVWGGRTLDGRTWDQMPELARKGA